MLGRLFGDEQNKEQRYGFPVGRVEGDRRRQPKESAAGFLQPFYATVRNGDTLAKPSRTKLFAREKAIEDRASGYTLVVLEKQADLFENAFLTARVQIENDVFRIQ